MIEIGLIGAPKTGKTNLARQVAARVYEGKPPPGSIFIDGIPEYFERYLNLGVGASGTPQVNLMIFFERMRRERLASQIVPHEPFSISCGTDVDSLAYSQWIMEIFEYGFLSPEMAIHAERALLALQTIAHYSIYNFDRKTLLYYLPVEGRNIEHEDIGFFQDIDKHIRSVIQTAKLTIPVLRGSLKENTDRIVNDVKELGAVPVSK